MHWQAEPKAEGKLIRCTQGVIYDQIIDLRKDSSSYGQSFGTELSATNSQVLYVPKGFAHGFQTLTENAIVYYQMDESYAPELAQGLRYNDPAFELEWPLPVVVISEKDRNYADYCL